MLLKNVGSQGVYLFAYDTANNTLKTGDASNMAADVDMNYGNLDENQSGNVSAFPRPKPETLTSRDSSSTAKPASSVIENTASNAVSNSQ